MIVWGKKMERSWGKTKNSEKQKRSIISMKSMVGIKTADIYRSKRWAKGLSWQIRNEVPGWLQ